MWLLNTSTNQLISVQYPSQTSYAILSHVWDPAGEQTFQDIKAIHASARSGFQVSVEDTDPRLLDAIRAQLSAKITRCCDYARARGYLHLWIETCCIDKTSSAELSEAMNSMFDWYLQADVCYVFLSDVLAGDDPEANHSSFRCSMWFKRGWILQELIVPSRNVFLSKDYRMIGTKASLAEVVQDITGIHTQVLLHKRQLHTVSVAQRMAWASGRKTTRVEDETYCLMDIFGVRLPVIYGEGSQAFARLQEEIMRRIPDQSLFLWGAHPENLRFLSNLGAMVHARLTSVPTDELRASKSAYLFASCPMDFHSSGGFSPIPLGMFRSMLGLSETSRPPLYTPSGYGVCTTFPICTVLFPNSGGPVKMQLAILACRSAQGRIPALILSPEATSTQHLIGGFDLGPRTSVSMGAYGSQYSNCSSHAMNPTVRYSQSHPRFILLDSNTLRRDRLITSLAIRDVCIPHQHMSAVSGLAALRHFPKPRQERFTASCKIILPCHTMEHLGALGFSANVAIQDGEMVPIYLRAGRSSATLGGSRRGSHDFVLSHVIEGTLIVTVFKCPFRGSSYAPLHATVTWTPVHDVALATQAGESEKRTSGSIGDVCACEHVNTWTDARRRFHRPPGAPAVTLRFSLMDERSECKYGAHNFNLWCDLYALGIHVDPLPGDTAG